MLKITGLPFVMLGILALVLAPNAMSQRNGAFADLNPQTFATLIVYGTVTLADGTPPGQLVLIERVCKGVAQRGGFADSKGRFSFDLGALNKTIAAGSISLDLDTNQLAGRRVTSEELESCTVRATLPGYLSSSLPMGKRDLARNNQLGTIKLEPIGRDHSPMRSESDDGASKNARKFYNKGLDLAANAKWPEALDNFSKAASAYPKYASAWLSMGMLQAGGNSLEAARTSYANAMAADPKFLFPLIAGAELEAGAGQWSKTAELSGRVIEAKPALFPRAYVLNATANLNLKKLDQMARSATAGLQLDPQHRFPDLEYFAGIAQIAKHDKPGAVAHLEAYLTLDPAGSNAQSARSQLASLRPAR